MTKLLRPNIRAERARLNMSAPDLAALLRVSKNAIYRWEQGESTPNGNALLEMAEIFSVEPKYLMEQKQEPPTTEQEEQNT